MHLFSPSMFSHIAHLDVGPTSVLRYAVAVVFEHVHFLALNLQFNFSSIAMPRNLVIATVGIAILYLIFRSKSYIGGLSLNIM